jgi:hypothetical protein
MKKHCCERMEKDIEFDCDQHSDIFSCPDVLIQYIPKFNEYGIIIHDGGNAVSKISFCPWCGIKLPLSKRDEWFESHEELGFDDPSEQEIPKRYESDAWYRNT